MEVIPKNFGSFEKLNAIRFQGKPVKIYPRMYSVIPNIKDIKKNEPAKFFFLLKKENR